MIITIITIIPKNKYDLLYPLENVYVAVGRSTIFSG